MGVVGCYHLGRRKSKKGFELNGYRRSHCQEPLAGASRVFTDITPFVSGGEWKEFKASERSLKQVKGAQSK